MGAYGVPLVAACFTPLILFSIGLLLRNRSLVSSNRQLVKTTVQEALLKHAAVEFARGDDLESTAEAAVKAAVVLADPSGSGSAFLWMATDGAKVVATAGQAPSRPGEPIDATLLAQWEAPTTYERLTKSDKSIGAQLSSFPERCVAPVFVGDEVIGKLIVNGIPTAIHNLFPRLRRMCDQMGWALQSAEVAEEQVQRSERRFRSFVQDSSDTVTLLGRDGVVLYQSASGRSASSWEGPLSH